MSCKCNDMFFNQLQQIVMEHPIIKSKLQELNLTVKELADIVALLDESTIAYIKRTIDNMVQSGQFDAFLHLVVEPLLKEQTERVINKPVKSNIDFIRVGRVLRTSEPEVNESATGPSAKLYSFNQGGCHFTHNGVEMFAQAFICQNYSDYRYDDNVQIVLYNAHTLRSISSNIFSVGHANGMCYKDGYLYITHTSEYNGSTTADPSNRISRIKVDNFDRVSTMETKSAPTVVKGVTDIDSYGNDLYIQESNNSHNIYRYNWDENTVSKIATVSLPNYPYYSQTFSITEEYIYLLYYCPNCIVRYNRISNKVDYVYRIPQTLDSGRWTPIECEWIKVYDDGTCFIEAGGHLCSKSACMKDIAQFFKQNLKTQEYINPLTDDSGVTAGSALRGENYQVVLYVGDSTTNNPTGTPDNPFYSLDEACLFAMTSTINTSYKLIVTSSMINSTIFVMGRSLHISCDSNVNITCGNVVIENGSLSVTAESGSAGYLQFKSRFPQGMGSHVNKVIDASDGQLYLQKGAILSGNNATTGLYVRRMTTVISSEFNISSSIPTPIDDAISITFDKRNNKILDLKNFDN